MKQKILLTMFALWLLFMVSSKQIFALGENASATQDSATTPTPETAVHMMERINDYRTELDLPVYYHDQALTQASQWVVDTMAATEFISHYDENGANPQQRAEKAGYDEHVTEIIFGGLGGADAAWEWWAENELHHGLLISEDYVEFGVGTAIHEQSGRQYWAVMFGFGDGQYEMDGRANGHDGEVDVSTKLPSATSTAEVTAVPPTAVLPDPTATSEQVALITEDESAYPGPSSDNSGNKPDMSRSSNNNSVEESKWLIIAAVGTIVFSVAVFYFPRHGLSQKFKEPT
jgi:uncharacterized protein YkwD